MSSIGQTASKRCAYESWQGDEGDGEEEDGRSSSQPMEIAQTQARTQLGGAVCLLDGWDGWRWKMGEAK